jgi:tRNA U38,U39,U40 pseudouridine synthase TruA
MVTIKLTIEYDGTLYAGWQQQPNHLPSSTFQRWQPDGQIQEYMR